MRFTTRSEIEYLDSIGTSATDPHLIDEMQQRLDALRRYDQNFSESDWRPHAIGNWPPDSQFKQI